MRSEARPFVIFEPGNKPLVYVGRVRDEVTNFPAYNHWPVSQVRSDGRFAQAADRATSFSISQNRPTRHTEDGGFEWVAMLYGATFDEPSTLRAAREVLDASARATGAAGSGGEPRLRRRRSARTCCAAPSDRPAASCRWSCARTRTRRSSTRSWSSRAMETGRSTSRSARERLEPGRTLRTGYRKTLDGTDLLVWLERTSTEPVVVRISREPRALTPARGREVGSPTPAVPAAGASRR